MASTFQVVIVILLLQVVAHGKENATKEIIEQKVINHTLVDLDEQNITTTQAKISKSNTVININNQQDDLGQRQKRDYNFDGFQPFPSIYPGYASRNDPSNNGAYGQEDPLVQIHKRLSHIAEIVKQPTMPPVPPATRYPIFLPLLYLPSSNCRCTPGKDKRPPQRNPAQAKPTETKPKQPTLASTNITNVPVYIPSRGPEIFDSVNTSFLEHDEDFSRPISFDPIPAAEGVKRQPPPVEHGSVEGETTSESSVGSINRSPPITGRNPTHYIPTLPTSSLPTPDLPTLCDRAIINCCHQVTMTYNCFASQGCADPSLYDKPCDTAVILNTIKRLQRYYTQINNSP